MMHAFSLDPRDILFFRDARPMGGSDAGRGARLPRPDQLHTALLSAFFARWPERQDWEGDEHTFRRRTPDNRDRTHDRNDDSSLRFGALRVVGPFVADSRGVPFFPTPLDWNMRVVPLPNGTDLPNPLVAGFLPVSREKRIVPPLVPAGLFADYLSGRFPDLGGISIPFGAERTIQTAIDPASGTSDDGRLFQAEYLRLAPGARLVFLASCVIHPKGGGPDVDVFARPDAPDVVQIGGQGGLARLSSTAFSIPESTAVPSRRIRWTLLTLALFNAGWRPGWVDEASGRVRLKCGDTGRRPGESRAAWRARIAEAPEFPTARLVAARIGKPEAFSGWDVLQNAPKPTVLAVPAGSCYVFDCDSPDEAAALASTLSGMHPHSDLFGEKGFGIGVCSFVSDSRSTT